MTINQMKYFIEVYVCGNMTKASKLLYVSQPALSKAIKEIEDECGTALFNRSGKAVYPTEEGTALYEELKPIVEQYDKVETKIQTHGLSRNCVRISYTLLSGFSSFVKILKAFKQEHPDIDVMSDFNNTKESYKLLDSHKVDLIVAMGPKEFYTEAPWINQDQYESLQLSQTEMLFVMNKNNMLAKEEFITWEQIGASRLILFGDEFNVGYDIANTLKDRGLYDPSGVRFTNQIYVALELIKNTDACALLPRDMIESYPELMGVPCAYHHQSRSNRVSLVWRRDMPMFWGAKAFADTARHLTW